MITGDEHLQCAMYHLLRSKPSFEDGRDNIHRAWSEAFDALSNAFGRYGITKTNPKIVQEIMTREHCIIPGPK